MRRAATILVLLCVAAPLSAEEPVNLREIWLDDARQRHVNVRISLPTAGDPPFPVVLFSSPQGFRWGGYVDHYNDIAEELAGRGIAMVLVSHYDLDEPLSEGETFQDVYPGIRTGSRNDASVDRHDDVRFVLDSLARFDGLDTGTIGVAGHSSGVLTALHACGMPVRDREGEIFSAGRDDAIRAFAIFGYPLEYTAPPRADLAKIQGLPGLHVVGDEDHPEYRHTSYRYIGGAPQYWMVARGDHNVGARGSETLVRQATGAFFAAYLRDDPEALAELDRDALQNEERDLVEWGTKPADRGKRLDHRDFVAWLRDALPWGRWLHDRSIAYHRSRETAP